MNIFEAPAMEIQKFDVMDVITTSDPEGGDVTPPVYD